MISGFIVYFEYINVYSRRLKCPLHILSYASRIGLSVMSCKALNFLLALHFNAISQYCAYRKCYNVCARSLLAETIPYIERMAR